MQSFWPRWYFLQHPNFKIVFSNLWEILTRLDAYAQFETHICFLALGSLGHHAFHTTNMAFSNRINGPLVHVVLTPITLHAVAIGNRILFLPSSCCIALLQRKKLNRKMNLCATTFPTKKKWEKLNRGVSKPGGFPLFSGKVLIVSRTLSGLFLVGAVHRPRKRKRGNQENPRRVLGQIGEIPENRESPKKDKKGRTSPDRETPCLKPPPPFGGP